MFYVTRGVNRFLHRGWAQIFLGVLIRIGTRYKLQDSKPRLNLIIDAIS